MRFPLPNIEDVLTRLAKKGYFAKLDLMMGYHQWTVSEESIPLTAFVTSQGLYEYTRVPFGCKNAPSGFQQIMREILGHVSGIYCEVYMDDIIIAAETPELLCEHVKIVLTQLNIHNVLVKPSKCKWGMTEIEFLGHIITKETRRLTPGRGKKVLDLPPPKNPKEVRTFLGLVNAFQDYIPDFAIQQKIFSVMTSGTKPFEWGEKQQIGF
jgi:hypothetical protein